MLKKTKITKAAATTTATIERTTTTATTIKSTTKKNNTNKRQKWILIELLKIWLNFVAAVAPNSIINERVYMKLKLAKYAQHIPAGHFDRSTRVSLLLDTFHFYICILFIFVFIFVLFRILAFDRYSIVCSKCEKPKVAREPETVSSTFQVFPMRE